MKANALGLESITTLEQFIWKKLNQLDESIDFIKTWNVPLNELETIIYELSYSYDQNLSEALRTIKIINKLQKNIKPFYNKAQLNLEKKIKDNEMIQKQKQKNKIIEKITKMQKKNNEIMHKKYKEKYKILDNIKIQSNKYCTENSITKLKKIKKQIVKLTKDIEGVNMIMEKENHKIRKKQKNIYENKKKSKQLQHQIQTIRSKYKELSKKESNNLNELLLQSYIQQNENLQKEKCRLFKTEIQITKFLYKIKKKKIEKFQNEKKKNTRNNQRNNKKKKKYEKENKHKINHTKENFINSIKIKNISKPNQTHLENSCLKLNSSFHNDSILFSDH
jgi:hypothetical protein